MVLDLLDRDLPPANGVALFARRPKLALVDIGVAIGAPASDITEHQLGMALRTGDVLVHAPQRIPGLIVVKLRNAADGLPCTECVAVLARNVQGSVRAACSGARLLGVRALRACEREQQQ